MRVYVVGFAPADDRGTVGGFDWYPEDEYARAVDRMRELLTAETDRDLHSFTFVPLDVPDGVAKPYNDDQAFGVVARDAVTAWIDANLHLVEVGLQPDDETLDERRETGTCIVYGCGEPADGDARIAFALPGGGKTTGPVCAGHRETLARGSLDDVSLGDPLTPEAREAVERLLDAPPTQTRPSAILRRPAPDATVVDCTTAELLVEALSRANEERESIRESQQFLVAYDPDDRPARSRELSIFITLVEDAITRHNKAVYMRRGVFAITDAERIPE